VLILQSNYGTLMTARPEEDTLVAPTVLLPGRLLAAAGVPVANEEIKEGWLFLEPSPIARDSDRIDELKFR
jgi:hypothetical protein